MHFKITGIKRQILISAVLYLGQILVGYTVSWPGPIFPKLRDLSQSPLSYIPSETQISLIASCIYIGGLAGPYLTGWLSNIKGRKPCLILGGVLSCVSNVILIYANNLAMFYCGRMLSGLGAGIVAVMNLVYLGEIASSNIRGILLTGLGIFTTCGLILLFSVGPYLSYSSVTSVGLAASLVFTLCALFIPESPFFYILVGKENSVRENLKDLGRDNDFDKILESKEKHLNSTSKKDWIELITLRSNRKALLIAFVLSILHHCSGYYAVLAFSGSIFEMAGSSVSSDIAMLVVGFFQLCGSTAASIFVERYGRKTLMVVSCAICCLSMLFLGAYFYLDFIDYSGLSNVKWLSLVLIVVFFIGYDIGLGIIPNVLLGELFTINVRSKGSAVAVTSSWVTAFLVMTAYGVVTQYFGVHFALWFFSFACLIALFYTIFCVPETKGKSLLEIQEILNQ